MASNLLQALQRKGWSRTRHGPGDPRSLSLFLTTIAQQIGKPITQKSGVTEKITPRKMEKANPNSLSGRYGLAPFPLHCDTSQWPTPCRFLLLACVHPGSQSTPTLLLDTAKVVLSPTERRLALSSAFLIRNGRNSFYSTILSSHRHFIRYDPACMKAIDEKGSEAIKLYDYPKYKNLIQKITLNAGDVLAIDNWRTLHGRGKCPDIANDRTLLRVYVQ